MRFMSKHQTVVSKKSHYRQGGAAGVKNNVMMFSKKRGKKKVQAHTSALGDKEIVDSSMHN